MFVSIRTKLFIVIVLANVLMVSVLLALNAATFKRSFSDYVASQESRRMQPLLLNIADEYERQGNWRWLRWDNPGWINVVQSSFSARDLRSMDRGQPGPRPGDMPMNNRNFLERLIIRDTRTGQVLLGRKKAPDQMVWLPIVSADDVVVAELGFETRTRLDAEFDQVFAEKRQRDLIYIGALGLLIAGALAIPFSGWLVRPVRKITRAVRTMTNGDLDVSVSVAGNDELGQLAADVNRLSQTLR
ncbi:MAG: HAMP domain-containing protein, partial [Reinekea sp.]|nr:HAMP domain-containing protein [Reinekea sp.]